MCAVWAYLPELRIRVIASGTRDRSGGQMNEREWLVECFAEHRPHLMSAWHDRVNPEHAVLLADSVGLVLQLVL
jgi:hypothetical protein